MAKTRPDPALLLERSPARELIAAEPPSACHLVGGAIRDWLLESELAHDWDLVVDGQGAAYAARLARRLGGRVVEPGGTRFAIHRVVAAAMRIDIWDRHGTPLDSELARRDFTINSIALDLADGTLYDPLRGCRDLAAGRLRANRPETFRDDPLRILRLIRFELDLPGFEATAETLAAARHAVTLLPTVSPERIREELDRILSRRPAERLGGRLTELDLHPRLWAAETVAANGSPSRRRGGDEPTEPPDREQRP
ncbi:MAG: hypothetical protein R3244_00670, partial [Thermoanaerobaculia bacterium]|nr:hypothetical protein [Thermoanaerobaculia bacterium]